MRESDALLWYDSLLRDCRNDQSHRSALRHWRGCDGDNWGHHVASLRDGEARASPPLEVVSPSLADSSRIVCSDNDLL
jgi:hypothetical protein